ncbi:hypothetical protein [Leucobacter chromiisoli]|uniref:hypothetical protein n=1 Tax=Leucobacter chromiisoli TaxID=2796471 RepID=UPI00190316D2|nr:hypothetical protein [Leucobacter chromiisoli]
MIEMVSHRASSAVVEEKQILTLPPEPEGRKPKFRSIAEDPKRVFPEPLSRLIPLR